MNRTSLQQLSVQELVEHFMSIALSQDEAILMDEHSKYNRLYDLMDDVRAELKSREGDQRTALQPLLLHPNAQVRLKSAISTLALAPIARWFLFDPAGE